MTRKQALLVQETRRQDFQAADDAWGRELVRLFGKNAGHVRYTAQGKGTTGTRLYALHYDREAARVAWHDAVDFAREC